MRYVTIKSLLQFASMFLGCLFSAPALAQDYRFEVEVMELQVTVQPDASAILEYRIVFNNMPGAHVIDVVDVGLPHSNYDTSNMSASIDGKPLRLIRKSTYINVGVEVNLGDDYIAAGRRGEFKFQCTMPDMVYQDTTDKNYASLQIIPTWFDAKSTVGKTRLMVAFNFLPGVKADQIKYQSEEYKYTGLAEVGDDKRAVAAWVYESWPLSSNNPKLSASFPKTGMDRVVTISRFGMLLKWFRENPQAQMVSFIGLGILFAITFFRFSHGTGFALFFILSAAIALPLLVNSSLHLVAWPAMMGLFFFNESILRNKSEKIGYLPAMATVEGGGIKRGLTAPQAGVLLEMPMGKVLTLVIFGMLKKGALERIADDPLSVRVAQEFVSARRSRLETAGEKGIVLHDYEHAFLDRLQAHQGPVKNCDLSEAFGGLVKSVASRMSGFDLSETKTYYRAIIERAWKEAETVGEIPQRDEVVDRNFEWILLDDHWTDIFERWARSGRPYRPWWERRRSGPVIINSGGNLGGGGTGESSQPSVPETSKTTLSEVAAGFAGWTENTMASFASAIEPAKMGLDIPTSGGILDLSGVDRVTGDVFKALAEAATKGGGGGGGGGGCACACAGCACACACAGGGR